MSDKYAAADELFLNAQEIASQLRHLAENEIDSDSFAVVTENYNGRETEFERSIADLAIDAAVMVESLLAEREADKARIAWLEKRLRGTEESLIAATDNIAELDSRKVRLPGGFSMEEAKELHKNLVSSHISKAMSSERMKKTDRDADLRWIHGVLVSAAWFVESTVADAAGITPETGGKQ